MEQQVGYFRFLWAIENAMRDAITAGTAIAGAISMPVWTRLSIVSSFCSGCGAGCAGAGCLGCGFCFGSSRYTAVTVRSLVTESNEVSHPANSYPSMVGASGAVAASSAKSVSRVLRFRVVRIHAAVSPHLLELAVLALLLRLLFLFLGFLFFLLGLVDEVHHCWNPSCSHPQSLSNLLAVRIVLFVEIGGTTVFGAVHGVPDCGYLVDADVSARPVDGKHAAFVLDSIADPFGEYIP